MPKPKICHFELHVLCSDCGEKLNSTIEMTKEELEKSWSRLVMSSPLVTGACPKGCVPTYSDCNANTKLKIYDMESKSYIDTDEFFKKEKM